MVPAAVLVIEAAGKSEPRCEKTGLRGIRPDPTNTGLYNQRKRLEA